MRVLFDTSVILDIALGRQPFAESSLAAFEKARADGELPLIAPHSLATFYYIVARAHGKDRARIAVDDLLMTAEVGHFDQDSALRCSEFEISDFEDAMVVSTAIECAVDCIITRNEPDFRGSPVIVKSPETFNA